MPVKQAEKEIEITKPSIIESENTLTMIQNQLGGSLVDTSSIDAPGISKPAKKKVTGKKTFVKKKVAKKEKVDTETRFFNNYSENPHL